MRVIGRINYLEPVQSVSHRHTFPVMLACGVCSFQFGGLS